MSKSWSRHRKYFRISLARGVVRVHWILSRVRGRGGNKGRDEKGRERKEGREWGGNGKGQSRSGSCAPMEVFKSRRLWLQLRFCHYCFKLKLRSTKFHTFTQRRLRHTWPVSLMTQMRRNAAASLPSSWRRWTEAAFGWCVAWFWAKCHQCVKDWKYEIFSI